MFKIKFLRFFTRSAFASAVFLLPVAVAYGQKFDASKQKKCSELECISPSKVAIAECQELLSEGSFSDERASCKRGEWSNELYDALRPRLARLMDEGSSTQRPTERVVKALEESEEQTVVKASSAKKYLSAKKQRKAREVLYTQSISKNSISKQVLSKQALKTSSKSKLAKNRKISQIFAKGQKKRVVQ